MELLCLQWSSHFVLFSKVAHIVHRLDPTGEELVGTSTPLIA